MRIGLVNICFSLAFLLHVTSLYGQDKQTRQDNQIWLGYMTSSRVSEKYSIWNDAHLVPESFAIVRTGLTRHLAGNANVTAGYAYLWLPASAGQSSMKRHEHRPWAQVQTSFPVASTWSISNRVRYDARFKENVQSGEIIDGYTFNHRVRFLMSLRKDLSSKEKSTVPYLVLSDELLLNFGEEVVSTFDQNRLSLSFGVQKGNTQYQLGFMNRFVQNSPTSYTLNHTLVFWVIQKFDLRKIFDTEENTHILSE